MDAPAKTRRRKLLLLALAVVTAGGWLAARTVMHRSDASNAAAPAPAVPVTTALVARQSVPIYLAGIGTAQPTQSVTVKARVDGQLDKVAFVEGQDVKAGDLLAQLDPRPLQAQLDQALAQKAHDEALLAAALKDLDRYTTLVAQDSIQQQTLDTQRSTVAQLKASLQSDQAQIDNARVQLGFTTIRAPVSGRTGLRLVDAGNIVHAADTTGLVVINQIDPITVLFTLPEADFQKTNQAMLSGGKTPLVVQAFAREDGAAIGSGKLLLLNNQIDTTSGTFQLKAQFPNAAHRLWPGQYVNVHLVLGERRDATVVPQAAIQRGPNGLFAYVVGADDTVMLQPIRVAQTQEGTAIVDSGLDPGQRVVVEGQYKVKPGIQVAESRPAAIAGPVAQRSASP